MNLQQIKQKQALLRKTEEGNSRKTEEKASEKLRKSFGLKGDKIKHHGRTERKFEEKRQPAQYCRKNRHANICRQNRCRQNSRGQSSFKQNGERQNFVKQNSIK